MINIPAEEINARSPYEVIPMGTDSFVFITSHGLKYNVGFSENFMLTDDDGMYEFYITNVEHKHSQTDPLVFETIKVIIEVFFQQAPVVMLYICDTSDNRQGVRDRLFRKWFDDYLDHNLYTLINESVTFDGVSYFGSALLQKKHPEHDSIVTKFHTFMEQLPQKIDELQNQQG